MGKLVCTNRAQYKTGILPLLINLILISLVCSIICQLMDISK